MHRKEGLVDRCRTPGDRDLLIETDLGCSLGGERFDEGEATSNSDRPQHQTDAADVGEREDQQDDVLWRPTNTDDVDHRSSDDRRVGVLRALWICGRSTRIEDPADRCVVGCLSDLGNRWEDCRIAGG